MLNKPIISRPQRGLNRPSMPADTPVQESFASALLDDGDETLESVQSHRGTYTSVEGDEILNRIHARMEQLQREHPEGGVEQSRILDTDILMSAPPDYFDEFSEHVVLGANYVQGVLAQDDRSDLVNEAQLNPTDEKRQNEAYFTVSSVAADYCRRAPFVGVKRELLNMFICNEIIGLSVIDPLWRDAKVTEIFCNGPFDIQAEIGGRVHKVPACKFNSEAHLMRLLERLFRSVGRVLSQSTPRVKGRLHDKSRLHAVHSSVAPGGPNVNIRKHPDGYWTPSSIIRKGTASEELMAYVGNLMQKGCSVLTFGGMGSGKTSLMNALTSFYPDSHRIVTLEDNLEMKVNPRKFCAIPMECKSETPGQPGSGVSMRDLVQAATQMRPDIIIVGETTDGAAYDLCQSLNTGHYGISTVHANNPQAAITRLCSLVTQSGLVNLENAQGIVKDAFDVMVEVARLSDGSRKVMSVSEVGTDSKLIDGKLVLPVRLLWKFVEDKKDENGKIHGHWEQVGELSKARREMKMLDLKADLTWEELKQRSTLPPGIKEE